MVNSVTGFKAVKQYHRVDLLPIKSHRQLNCKIIFKKFSGRRSNPLVFDLRSRFYVKIGGYISIAKVNLYRLRKQTIQHIGFFNWCNISKTKRMGIISKASQNLLAKNAAICAWWNKPFNTSKNQNWMAQYSN